MLQLHIIYRHDSSQMVAGRIIDHLQHRYGLIAMSHDIVGFSPVDYAYKVNARLLQCQVVLVIMGPEWRNALAPGGRRWQDDPADPVAIELATALRLGKLVVPLLVQGATMPAASELPASIHSFVLRQGIVVRGDPAFVADMQKVYAQINTQLAWRPANVPLLVGALLMFFGLFIFDLFVSLATPARVETLFYSAWGLITTTVLIVWIVSFLGTLVGAFLLAIQRHQRGWLIGLSITVGAGLLSLLSLLYIVWFYIYAIVIMIFAVFGKRRETA